MGPMKVNGYDINLFEATMVAEGAEEPTNEEHYFACWQYLVVTGMAWKLQGWYGRTAMQFIESGHILSAQDYASVVNQKAN